MVFLACRPLDILGLYQMEHFDTSIHGDDIRTPLRLGESIFHKKHSCRLGMTMNSNKSRWNCLKPSGFDGRFYYTACMYKEPTESLAASWV